MGDRSAIEWTDASWNPVTGCTKVSRGCDNCYAAELANGRLRDVYLKRRPVLPMLPQDPFAVRLWPERLDQPLRWKRPRRIFVNSMSDLFHREVPPEYLEQIFQVMLEADWHQYQVLTKRPARAARFWEHRSDPFEHVPMVPAHIWMGTSVEDAFVAYRIKHLQDIPAHRRFLSIEPLLGPVRLDGRLAGIHWVIVGGESGRKHRPMDLDHARQVRDACVRAGVPFFFKQVGGRTPKAGGRVLDGRTWDEYPDAAREVSGAER